jgi:hypothetical protein
MAGATAGRARDDARARLARIAEEGLAPGHQIIQHQQFKQGPRETGGSDRFENTGT